MVRIPTEGPAIQIPLYSVVHDGPDGQKHVVGTRPSPDGALDDLDELAAAIPEWAALAAACPQMIEEFGTGGT